MCRACGTFGGGCSCSEGVVGNPKGKRPLGRPRFILEDIIKMDLQEVEVDREDWMELAQDR